MKDLRSIVRYYTEGLYRELSEKEIGLWSQAIAFKVLVTTIPLAALGLGVTGWVIRTPDTSTAVVRFAKDIFPADQARAFLAFLDAFKASSPALASIGGVTLLVSVVFLFTTLRLTVSNAFEQTWHEDRTIVQGYLFDLRMTGQVGVLFLATIALSIGMQSVLRGSGLLQIASVGMSLFITTLMFAQLYYFVPQPRPAVESALLGAVAAGTLWEVAKQLFTLLATSTDLLDVSSPASGMEVLADAFILLIAFVTWVYYSGLVLLLGAVIASLHEAKDGERLDS